MLTSPLQIIPLPLHPRCPSPPPHSPAPFSPLSISSGSLVPIYTHGGVSNQEHARTRQNTPEHARTRQGRTRNRISHKATVSPPIECSWIRPLTMDREHWEPKRSPETSLGPSCCVYHFVGIMRCYSKVYLFSVMQVCCILASDLVNMSLTPSEQRGMTISVQA